MDTLLQNISEWRARIDEASVKWGGCTICGVSKTVDAQTVNRAWEGGIRILGENRVQEVLAKKPELDPRFEIHLIGQLQTNKVKQILPQVAMIQSLDREALALEISRRASAMGIEMPVLLQVNIGREPQKSGVFEEELDAFASACSALPGLRVKGLMTVMPACEDPEEIRPLFRKMRTHFERLRDAGMNMEILSMGMSSDAVVAAQEGSTMVRLGRAIFGERPKKI